MPDRMADRGGRLAGLLLWRRTDRFWIQASRYLVVGGAAAVVDTGLVYLLGYRLGVDSFVSVAIAFLVGCAVNYAGCVLLIFQTTHRYRTELATFLAVSAVGLAINELVIYLLYSRIGVQLLAAKVVAVAVAMLWNFALRRALIFRRPADGPR
jgi:putative flippase GtrA